MRFKTQSILFLFLLLSFSLRLVPIVSASTSIDVDLVLSSSDYPTYGYGVNANPTIYVNWLGRNHILMVLSDRIRDYDLSNEIYIDRIYVNPLNCSGTSDKIVKTIWYNQTDHHFYTRVYTANHATKFAIYDVHYNLETFSVEWTYIKEIERDSDGEWSTIAYSNCIGDYIYTGNSANGTVQKINWVTDSRDKTDTEFGIYSAEPTSKTFTRLGYNYMFLGRHLAGYNHSVMDLNNLTITDTLESQGDGSPRSNIGAPFKTSSMSTTYWPLTGGGVDQDENNDILWYETDPSSVTITKKGETHFLDADFPNPPYGNVDPWACYLIAKLTDGKYFGVCHVAPKNVAIWMILNADFTVYEFGKFSSVPMDNAWMYNCYPEYGDVTNYPVVDRENKEIYILLRNYQDAVYRVDLFKIGFSVLDIAEWNEYGYIMETYTGEEPTEEPKLSLYLLPYQVGNVLGIGYMGGGLVLSSMLILAFMIPVLRGRNILLPIIVGFVALGLLTFLGWLPFWILLLVLLTVAGLWASGISKLFHG